MANTIEELRAENPELVSQLESAARADAVQQEQARLQGIEKVAGLFNADMVNAAKYGDKACDAKELSYRAALEAAEKGQQFLSNMAADHVASHVAAVPAVPAPAETPEQKADEEKNAKKYKYPFLMYFGHEYRDVTGVFEEGKEYTEKQLTKTLVEHGFKDFKYAQEIQWEYF